MFNSSSSNSYMSISLGSVSGDVVCSFGGSCFPFLVSQNFALASVHLEKKKKKTANFSNLYRLASSRGSPSPVSLTRDPWGPVKLLGGRVHRLWAFTYNFSESCQLLIHEVFISCALWCLSVALHVIWFYRSKPPTLSRSQ